MRAAFAFDVLENVSDYMNSIIIGGRRDQALRHFCQEDNADATQERDVAFLAVNAHRRSLSSPV
jgi:hypothetical protein